ADLRGAPNELFGEGFVDHDVDVMRQSIEQEQRSLTHRLVVQRVPRCAKRHRSRTRECCAAQECFEVCSCLRSLDRSRGLTQATRVVAVYGHVPDDRFQTNLGYAEVRVPG